MCGRYVENLWWSLFMLDPITDRMSWTVTLACQRYRYRLNFISSLMFKKFFSLVYFSSSEAVSNNYWVFLPFYINFISTDGAKVVTIPTYALLTGRKIYAYSIPLEFFIRNGVSVPVSQDMGWYPVMWWAPDPLHVENYKPVSITYWTWYFPLSE